MEIGSWQLLWEGFPASQVATSLVMISLRNFVLILLTLCSRELASTDPEVGLNLSILSVASLTLGFGVLTKMAAYRALRDRLKHAHGGLEDARDSFAIRRQTIERAWCIVLPAVMLGSGTMAWTQQFQADGWPQALLLLACFLPAVGFLMLAEVTAAQVDQICMTDQAGSSLNGNTLDRSDDSWLQQWFVRIRLGDMAGLITCLFPVIVLAGVSDFSGWTSQSLGTEWSWMKVPLSMIAVLSFVALFPLLLTRWSHGQELPHAWKARIDEISRRAGTRSVRAVMIPSQQRWAGAAIVGWFPPWRRLWLGDAIIQNLSHRQVDMVVLHELAHVHRMHFLWRIAPVALSVVMAGGLWAVGSQWGVEQTLPFKFLLGMIAGLTLLLGLGRVARICELDADLVACELASKSVDWCDQFSPARELSEALSLLLADTKQQAATWLHPSLHQRLQALSSWHPTTYHQCIRQSPTHL